MGLHTWFYKSKEKYIEVEKLYEQLDSHYRGDIFLDDLDILQIESKVLSSSENDADYHDIFRTNKRNEDGTYTEDIIWSKKECFEWLENNKELVYWNNTIFDTEEQIAELKKKKMKLLNQFWDEFPNGVIDFG